jgi:hypothetical protein
VGQTPYDQASRYSAKLDPVGFLRWLVQDPTPTWVFRGWLDTRTLPFPGDPDRTCDTVASLFDVASQSTWWALAVEFQGRPSGTMFGRMLEYLARLWLELRPPLLPDGHFQVVAAVVNLTGTGQTSHDMIFARTRLRTCLQVAERNLAEEDAAATLAGIAQGRIARSLLPWIPLMRGGKEPNIIEEWKCLAQQEPEARRRADYGGLALVFAELADCRPQWKEALEGWNVEQSQQVLEWQAIAEQRGREAGRVEGKAAGKAEDIVRLLERRLSQKAPPDLAAAVAKITDLARLDHLFDIALAAATFDDFRRLGQL